MNEFKIHGKRAMRIYDLDVDDKYAVTESGLVYRKERNEWIELKQTLSKRGYLCVTLYNSKTQRSKFINVHKLMKITFFDCRDPKIFINHKDLNRLNNNLSNLELTTCLENTHHAINNGAFKAVCVTDDMIDFIRRDIIRNPYKRKLKYYHDMFGISTTTVERIVRGEDSRTNTPGARTSHLSNLEDLLWLPNNHTYEDVERQIDFIIRNRHIVSINYMINVLKWITD